MAIVTLLAILFSPLIAVLVSVYIEDRREKRRQKLWIFYTLIATRRSPNTDETVRALNLIDVAFYDSPKIRNLWREFFDMLSNQGLSNSLGEGQRQNKKIEMLTEIAKVLGFGKEISHLDMVRVYSPDPGTLSQRSDAIADELLRVLKASGGVQVSPRDTGP